MSTVGVADEFEKVRDSNVPMLAESMLPLNSLRILLNSPFKALAVRVSPAFQLVNLEMIAIYLPSHTNFGPMHYEYFPFSYDTSFHNDMACTWFYNYQHQILNPYVLPRI